MKVQHIFLATLMLICLSSCVSYRVFPKEHRNIEIPKSQQKVFVLNDSLERELFILKKIKIFSFQNDSSKADIKIKLYPIRKEWKCGQASMITMASLGQIPVTFTETYHFKFDEIKNQKVREVDIELKIRQSVWFWNILGRKTDFYDAAGKAILAEYFTRR